MKVTNQLVGLQNWFQYLLKKLKNFNPYGKFRLKGETMKSIVCFAIYSVLALSGRVHAGAYEDRELQQISTEFGTALENSNVKTVAMVSFKDIIDGNETKLDKFLAEKISVNLVNQNKNISVVDKANLDRIMQEQKLTEESLVDPENIKKLKLAGIDAIIFGTTAPYKGININLKAIATDTAKVVAEFRGNITETVDLYTIMGIADTQPGETSRTIQIKPSANFQDNPDVPKKKKTYDGRLTMEIKSVDFLKKMGKVRVTYSVILKERPLIAEYFSYQMAYSDPSNTPNRTPELDVVGGATDDKGNSYNILTPLDATAEPNLDPKSPLTFQIEYQMATNGSSTIQIPGTITFWFDFCIRYNILAWPPPASLHKLFVTDYPIDKIQ